MINYQKFQQFMININKLFKNKIIVITGGTGSFGKTMAASLLKFNPKEIRIFSRDENKQENMRYEFNNQLLKYYIGDIRDLNSTINVTEGANFLFHAAALKQVPSCEFYPLEAIKTNVLGTENVLNSCITNNIERAVFLSTDKAVYPINAMGQSKALMEKVVIAKSRMNSLKTKLSITRYGNVIASRGSVIPLFVNNILNGSDLTVTHHNMTRFMMFLEDSVDLVLNAFLKGRKGEIFVKKAPSAKIIDVANVLLDIFKSKSKIKISGPRHGEKIHESLISIEEMTCVKKSKDYFTIFPDHRDINYNNHFVNGIANYDNLKTYSSNNTKLLDKKEIKKLLLKIPIISNHISY